MVATASVSCVATKPHVPAIPPSERTVGQLVADTLRFYGSRFWLSLTLGVGPACLTVAAGELPEEQRLEVLATAWPVLMTASFIGACYLVSHAPFTWPRLWTASLVGLMVVIPVPLLVTLVVLPAVLWLALLGLAVPAAVREGTGVRESVRRGVALARVDYVHAAGTLATLVLLVVLTHLVLFQLLHGVSDQAGVIAAFLASVVITPLLFLGSALLYDDQVARAEVKSKPTPTQPS
jgi:hypothetical protein